MSGVISEEMAIRYALTGPVIRGSGIPYDLRRDSPHSLYPELDFDVIVGEGEVGDRWVIAGIGTSFA